MIYKAQKIKNNNNCKIKSSRLIKFKWGNKVDNNSKNFK